MLFKFILVFAVSFLAQAFKSKDDFASVMTLFSIRTSFDYWNLEKIKTCYNNNYNEYKKATEKLKEKLDLAAKEIQDSLAEKNSTFERTTPSLLKGIGYIIQYHPKDLGKFLKEKHIKEAQKFIEQNKNLIDKKITKFLLDTQAIEKQFPGVGRKAKVKYETIRNETEPKINKIGQDIAICIKY